MHPYAANSPWLTTGLFARAARCWAVVAVVAAAAVGFDASPAEAAQCGAKGQRACNIWERPGRPCNAGLIEKPFGRCNARPAGSAPAGPNCGRENQAACTVWQRPGRPCNAGLQLTTAIGGRCIKPTGAESLVRSLGSRIQGHTNALSAIRGCVLAGGRADSYRQALEAGDAGQAMQVIGPCLDLTNFSQLRRAPSGLPRAAGGAGTTRFFNRLSVGIATAVQLIGGAGVELGLVINLDNRGHVRFYTVSETAIGPGVSLGGDVTVGLSRGVVPTTKTVTSDTSWNAAGKLLAGGGLAVSFDGWHDGLATVPVSNFDGFGIAGGIGVGFDLLSKHQQVTTVW